MRIALGIPMKLAEIAKEANGELRRREDVLVTHLCTDTRETQPGDLFIAIKGDRFDGADFASEAKNKGAFVLSSRPDLCDIFHHDSHEALLSFASNYIKNLPYILYKIGITGSVGKTTTKEFAKILLSEAFTTHASSGNFNNEIGLPLSILSAKKDTQILLMEMGMNGQGEISRLSKCLRPDIALITNIGTAHIGKLGSREKIAKAKLEVLDGMRGGVLIAPFEEILLHDIKEKECFSLKSRSADYYIEDTDNGHYPVYKNGGLFCEAAFSLTEEHHKYCMLAACAIAIKSGISPNQLSIGIAKISRDNIRQTAFFAEKYHFHNDCYNASRESMLSAINEFQKVDFEGKRSMALGDILELGAMSDEIHFEIGRAILEDRTNNLFLFGDAAEKIGLGAIENGFPRERIFINRNTDAPEITAKQIKSHCSAGEHILLKASRAVRLERVLNYFDGVKEKNG